MFYYNTSFHRSIKATPFFLTFGMEARQPSLPTPDMRRKFYGESTTDELIHRLLAARDTARRNNEIVSEKTEQDANRKTMPHNFVLLVNLSCSMRKVSYTKTRSWRQIGAGRTELSD